MKLILVSTDDTFYLFTYYCYLTSCGFLHQFEQVVVAEDQVTANILESPGFFLLRWAGFLVGSSGIHTEWDIQINVRFEE